MTGIGAIFRKELSDHFSSYRFTIIFALIAMASLITTYMAGIGLKEELAGVAKPNFVFLMLFTSTGSVFSLVQFVAFFGPLIGLLLGFDSINRERSSGTLSTLVSQPIYRDSIINGKFLAGVATIAIMLVAIVLVVTGLGLKLVGVVPGPEEIMRIVLYLVISIIYISFWLGASILFSILFRGVATSALATLAVWIFFSFFISIGAESRTHVEADIDSAKCIAPLTHETLQRRHGYCHRSDTKNDPAVCHDRAYRADVPGAFSAPLVTPAEPLHRDTSYHFADRHHGDLFCHLLRHIHEAGDTVAVKK